jgi:hypothetical protein
MSDMEDVDGPGGVINLVHDPVGTHPSRVQALQVPSDCLADPPRVLRQRTQDEVDHCHGDLGRETIESPAGRGSDPQFPVSVHDA